MLKNVLPVFIAVLMCSVAYAQTNTASSFYRSGIQYKNNNQLPEAMAAFKKAVALKKDFDSAYVEMGNINILSKNDDAGISNYKKALAINPKNTDALIALGKVYRYSRLHIDSVLFYFSNAVKIDSTIKEAFYNMAWAFNSKKEYDKAIQHAAKALEIDNGYRVAYGELGFSYSSNKKYAEAVEQFKKNLAISKVDIAMLYSGYAYTELNNKEAALEHYEALKKINERMANNLKKKIDAMPVKTD
ncbi:MAG: tetratricopeptide repeat protein [Chitinophagaceae bacterium]|nr:tetratricopeptide repeat protein [Chitinophagaceae bacterium]